MAEYKKGGLTGNSNLYATNRLFVKNPLFKKRKKKAPGVYSPTAKFRYKEGGTKDKSPAYIEKELTLDEIAKYRKGGYIVEEVNDPSIPKLGGFAKGGAQGCPQGTYWNGTKCTKLVTLKSDKKYIDGVANWAMHVSDPDMITSTYNDNIKERLYSGKWGFDPESGALVRLAKIQPQSVTTLDAKTKADREREKKEQEAQRIRWDSQKTYRQSIIDAGFDPATFGKAKGVNTITGEPIYASSKEEAERINQEAINQFAIEGNAAIVNNPVFQAASYFTPWGMAIGAMRGAARLAPDTYNFAKDPSWSGAGQIAMDIAETTPFAKPIANTVKSAVQNTYKINPWAEKLKNANSSYRVTGLDAAEDFKNTGILRSVAPKIKANFAEGILPARSTSFPSFQKGYADMSYLPEEGGVIFKTDLPTYKRGQINPVTGFPIKGRHYGHRVIDPKTGATMTEIPGENIRMFGDKPHWLKGYKEVPKELPGSPNASISDRLKQFFDRPPGPMMLLGPSGGTNMVKKNIPYYEQLLNTYDSKVMSATNKKFYKDLIDTAKKQDGMLTEAQLRELDRLKTGNFDFGKRGFNKESLTQVEPKAPIETSKSEFKSEIDWETFVKNKEDVVNNPDVIKELNTIEETTKANGTWMKNSDGTPFNGSPEQFVVQQSSRYKTAYPEGTDVVHRGIHKNSAPTNGTDQSSVVFTGDAPTAAQYIGHIDDVKRPLIKGLQENPLESPQNIITKYYDEAKNWKNQDPAQTIQKEIFDASKNLDDEVLGLYTPKTDNKIIIEGTESPGFNRAFNRLNVEKELGLSNNTLGQKEELQKFTNWMQENFPDRNLSDNVMTDHFAKYLNQGNSGLKRVDFNNITDPNILGNVQAIKVGKGDYLKSIRGNILFDMSNPNIYKAIIPTVGVTGLTGFMMNNSSEDSDGLQQKKKGGPVDDSIEIDIPEEEIQWYIDNGYIVEPVTKLKKFIG